MTEANNEQLREAVNHIDNYAQSACGEIVSLCSLALLSMEQPATYANGCNMDVVAHVLQAIKNKAQDAQNGINATAEEVGCNYVDPAERRRWEAVRVARGIANTASPTMTSPSKLTVVSPKSQQHEQSGQQDSCENAYALTADALSAKLFSISAIARMAAFVVEARRVLDGTNEVLRYMPEVQHAIAENVSASNNWRAMQDCSATVLAYVSEQMESINTQFTDLANATATGESGS